MPNIRAFLFTILVYITFTAALTDAASFGIRLLRKDLAGAEDVDTNVNQDKDPTTFSHLLSAVSPQALDRLLHQYAPGTFKNGVSSPDRKSVEVVPARTPEPPSRVVRMAIRQATSGNDTSTSDTTTSTTSSTSDTLSTTSTTSTKQTPMETTSTSQDTPTSPSSTPESTPTPTSTSASTPTMASTTEVTETTEPVETTSTTETSEPTSSSPPQTSESSSGTDSSTTSTFSTSTTPTLTSKTSTFTSTLPGGAVTTITEVAVITPDVTDTDGDSTPTTGIGNLQTGSAAPIVRSPGFEVFAGLLVGGVMMV